MNEGLSRQEQKQRQLEASFDNAFHQLQEIATILAETGLNVRTYVSDPDMIKTEWMRNTAFPIVSDGLDGIRVSRNRENSGFIVWFTNGFEKPDNPQRQEITAKLKAAGFEVV
ncbi:MAG: hypothetical protein WCX08_03350 [Candidatus Buchananbacteria bacterium]|jgi:hypothetical protein